MVQPEIGETLTTDRFLGGALSVMQPRDGFRAGSDAVLLAAAASSRRAFDTARRLRMVTHDA